MSERSQADELETNLIRSILEVPAASALMTVVVFGAAALTAWMTRDPVLAFLLAAMVPFAIGRLGLVGLYWRELAHPDLTLARARRIQRRCAVTYFAFAIVLGMFGGRAMMMPWPEQHMLITAILLGHCAGMVTNLSLRPRIAIPSTIATIVPSLVTMLSVPKVTHWATAVTMSALLVAGVRFVRARYARAAGNIAKELNSSSLARHDGLTGLPNRLALREWFDAHIARAERTGMLAVHFLDLNGFKPVNDRFGHATGDALLVAVSKRIAGTIRATDTAARLGGDEFAVLQCGIASADEAALLAKRLAAAIARPYRIGEHGIDVSTGIGYVVAENVAEDLECLLDLADDALYASKRSGGGVTRWTPDLDDPARAAA